MCGLYYPYARAIPKYDELESERRGASSRTRRCGHVDLRQYGRRRIESERQSSRDIQQPCITRDS